MKKEKKKVDAREFEVETFRRTLSALLLDATLVEDLLFGSEREYPLLLVVFFAKWWLLLLLFRHCTVGADVFRRLSCARAICGLCGTSFTCRRPASNVAILNVLRIDRFDYTFQSPFHISECQANCSVLEMNYHLYTLFKTTIVVLLHWVLWSPSWIVNFGTSTMEQRLLDLCPFLQLSPRQWWAALESQTKTYYSWW